MHTGLYDLELLKGIKTLKQIKSPEIPCGLVVKHVEK
jgi:hypothetical protein